MISLRIFLLYAFFFLFFALAGCFPKPETDWSPGQPGLQFVEGVPFFAQQIRDDCGPAALASLLAYRGVDPDLNEITAAVYDERLGGSLQADLENYARQNGLEVRSGRGDPGFLRTCIDGEIPVIVLVDMGFGPLRRPHYLVVIGYDNQDRFLLYDGRSPGLFLPADELQRRWEAMNRLYLYLP